MNSSAEAKQFAILRQHMVDSQLRARHIVDQRVLDAMQRVPRHEFTPERYRSQAYEDHPLPIGEGQTISQPYIVASMLDALQLTAGDKVLEVGTGSGYVTALLAELTARVISVERHTTLAEQASAALARLGYSNVKIVVGDGSLGYPAEAPYDAIIVSAAAPELPQALLSQLCEGGRMVVPVGTPDSQQLQLIRMQMGRPEIVLREPVRFVPLISGEQGNSE
jgi:protein-L-isoaspartate(D-aspartate) O-methyltransferase